MDANQRHKRLTQLVHTCAAMAVEERWGWLDAATRDDPTLRAEVEAVLSGDGASALESPVLPGFRMPSPESLGVASSRMSEAIPHPGRIGNFTILSLLGEGGMGVVYLAEQDLPLKRRVALKVIKPGMDSRQVLARFEQERQVLATMDHLNVARVFDAGTTALGQPYFTMEYVQGERITRYCRGRNLSTRERLGLFVEVCNAVQHAHSKGVIHRDLKPSNVLVKEEDGKPIPKVIDFGVSKAIGSKGDTSMTATAQELMLGTPEYMSPEQAGLEQGDVDTRTDVYSLGALLYELLTDHPPFDAQMLRSKNYEDMRRTIREIEPPRPSERVLTPPAGDKAVDAHTRALSRELARELDWIPLMAMRKDRRRRYETASELAKDIQRYLDNQPVLAVPESRAYRIRTFARRNKITVTAASLVAATLVVATAVSIGFALHARSQRTEAIRLGKVAVASAAAEAKARHRAELINKFVNDTLKSSDPLAGGKEDTTIAEAMESAIRKLESHQFSSDPETEANLQSTIATILQNNGQTAKAEPLFAKSLDTLRTVHEGDNADVGTAMNNLAYSRLLLGRATDATTMFVDALAMRRRLFPENHPDVAESLNNLAFAHQSLGQFAEAEPLYESAWKIYQGLATGDSPTVATTLNNLGTVRLLLGRKTEAEPILVLSLEMRQRLYPNDHPDVAGSMNNVAFVRQALGREREAEPLYAQAIAMYQRMYKGDQLNVANALKNRAHCLAVIGRVAEALDCGQQAVDMAARLSFTRGRSNSREVRSHSGRD